MQLKLLRFLYCTCSFNTSKGSILVPVSHSGRGPTSSFQRFWSEYNTYSSNVVTYVLIRLNWLEQRRILKLKPPLGREFQTWRTYCTQRFDCRWTEDSNSKLKTVGGKNAISHDKKHYVLKSKVVYIADGLLLQTWRVELPILRSIGWRSLSRDK